MMYCLVNVSNMYVCFFLIYFAHIVSLDARVHILSHSHPLKRADDNGKWAKVENRIVSKSICDLNGRLFVKCEEYGMRMSTVS